MNHWATDWLNDWMAELLKKHREMKEWMHEHLENWVYEVLWPVKDAWINRQQSRIEPPINLTENNLLGNFERHVAVLWDTRNRTFQNFSGRCARLAFRCRSGRCRSFEPVEQISDQGDLAAVRHPALQGHVPWTFTWPSNSSACWRGQSIEALPRSRWSSWWTRRLIPPQGR